MLGSHTVSDPQAGALCLFSILLGPHRRDLGERYFSSTFQVIFLNIWCQGFILHPGYLGSLLCQKSEGERQTLTASESIQGERWLRGHPGSGHVAEAVSKVEAGDWCGKMGDRKNVV